MNQQRHKQTLNLRTEQLKNVSHAPRLNQRRQLLNRAIPLIRAIHRTSRGDFQPLKKIRTLIEKRGSFLHTYDPVVIKQRLASDHFIITESSGLLHEQWRPVGDCQIEIPEDRWDAKPVVSLPGRTDNVFSPHAASIAQAIQVCPAIAAWCHDLCAEDAVANLGFASAAKCSAIHIIQEMNSHRCVPIRYLLGETFVIDGIELPSGQNILLKDYGQSPLENVASRRRNEGSRHYPAIPGWRLQRNVRIPTSSGRHLQTRWTVLIHDLTEALKKDKR